jgi:hypothetical protein
MRTMAAGGEIRCGSTWRELDGRARSPASTWCRARTWSASRSQAPCAPPPNERTTHGPPKIFLSSPVLRAHAVPLVSPYCRSVLHDGVWCVYVTLRSGPCMHAVVSCRAGLILPAAAVHVLRNEHGRVTCSTFVRHKSVLTSSSSSSSYCRSANQM